jgi:membrane protein implicated in regulation of membrane protease activity
VFLIVGIALLLVLPGPWNWIAAAVCLFGFAGEVGFWNRRVKTRKAATGVQTLVGKIATVTQSCRPRGQVRVAGELWEARCDAGADPGDKVRVADVQGLTLVVEPVEHER